MPIDLRGNMGNEGIYRKSGLKLNVIATDAIE